MKTRSVKATISDYVNGYINVGGFWSPRWCWMKIWDEAGVPKNYQNHILCQPAYTREELAEAGVWIVDTIEGIKAITEKAA